MAITMFNTNCKYDSYLNSHKVLISNPPNPGPRRSQLTTVLPEQGSPVSSVVRGRERAGLCRDQYPFQSHGLRGKIEGGTSVCLGYFRT